MKKKVLLFGVITVAIVGILVAVISTATNNGTDSSNSEESSKVETKKNNDVAYLNKDATLEEITETEGAVNIYMFWGNGCPHCKNQWEILEGLRKEYPNDFKVYGFEVWNNKSNLELLHTFADAMGDEVNAVPYTIIGDKSFTGTMSEKTIVEMIEKYKDEKIDIYFDRIKG